MNIITIIPIQRGITKDHLTYFSLEAPALGSLVEAPLRGKSIPGIVILVEAVQGKKTEIKRLPFGMKRLTNIRTKNFLLAEFMATARYTAEYYVATLGAVLSLLLPKAILEENATLAHESSTPPKQKRLSETLAFQASDEERFGEYKRIIRESFAKNESVIILSPTIEGAWQCAKILSAGIEKFSFLLHHEVPAKTLRTRLKQATTREHPVLIISTGYFMSLPMNNIKTIIVDREHDRAYHLAVRPFLDLRKFAELFAQELGATCILADTVLRLETLHRDLTPYRPLTRHLVSSAASHMVDARTKGTEKKSFSIIQPETEAAIRETISTRGHIFLFVARKGLAPTTVCLDCGETLLCPDCRTLLILKDQKVRHFVCPSCQREFPADTTCFHCKSWKLQTFGIASENTAEEVSQKFPDVPTFVMNSDTVKTRKDALRIMEKFEKGPAILIGTDLALPYLASRPVSVSAILSIDGYFGIPDFSMHERIFELISNIRARTKQEFLLQTRRPDEKIFEESMHGAIFDFYEREMAARKKFDYPPFKIFAKITLLGNEARAEKMMAEVKKTLEPERLIVFSGLQYGKKHALHGLLAFPPSQWPDPSIVEKLRCLPPEFEIRVEPESLL